MRTRFISVAGLAAALFTGSLALGIATQSCSSGSNPVADAGTADTGEETGPCSDGTIQLLACEGVDGAPPVETFSDEACQALDDAEHRSGVSHDAARAPSIDAPTEAQAVPSTAPFTFRWHNGTVAARTPRVPPRGYTLGDELARWTQLVPSADAHCAPFNGVAYAVVFRANGQELLRAETSRASYTPTADAWTRLRAARGTLELRVEVARFGTSMVTEGPYDQTTPRTFTLTP